MRWGVTTDAGTFNTRGGLYPMQHDTWHFLVLTYDGRTLKIYVDGLLGQTSDTGTDSQLISSTDSTHLYIGRNNSSAIGQDWRGHIAQVGILSAALSDDDVTALYNGGDGVTYAGVFGNTLPEGVVAAYPFAGTAEDTSGGGHHGTLVGGGYTDGHDGQASSAVVLSGADQYVSLGDLPDFDRDFSFVGWWRRDAGATTKSWRTVFILETHSPHFGVMYNTHYELFRIYNENAYGIRDVSFYWTEDAWVHVALTYDGSEMRLYIDGSLADAFPYTGSLNNADPVLLGANMVSKRFTYFWKGAIDEVAFFDRALDPDEVVDLMVNGVSRR
jgi:hypothetical protein